MATGDGVVIRPVPVLCLGITTALMRQTPHTDLISQFAEVNLPIAFTSCKKLTPRYQHVQVLQPIAFRIETPYSSRVAERAERAETRTEVACFSNIMQGRAQ